jgi:hypothetical protein
MMYFPGQRLEVVYKINGCCSLISHANYLESSFPQTCDTSSQQYFVQEPRYWGTQSTRGNPNIMSERSDELLKALDVKADLVAALAHTFGLAAASKKRFLIDTEDERVRNLQHIIPQVSCLT